MAGIRFVEQQHRYTRKLWQYSYPFNQVPCRSWERVKKVDGEGLVLGIEETLDAQCENVELFPAGKVYHVFENDEFVSKPPQSVSACRTPKELGTAGAIAEEEEARTGWKLYQVVDLRKDFGQKLFKCKMLKCHMPHM